jgi:co-chaperonin GroES (HSP10)
MSAVFSKRALDPIDSVEQRPKSAYQKYIDEHFPSVVYGGKPLGARVLVQLRTVVKRSAGGLYLPEETRDFNKGITCLGLVREIGPLAFCNRETMEPWPEGVWVQVGDLVMVERHAGRRFEVPIEGTDDKALFVVLNDHSIDWRVDKTFDNISEVNDQLV